jgi:hypothetical protein
MNPYLREGRLAEVIAAITALGNYRYYKLSFEQCAERIADRPQDAERWGQILAEHPEFFRVNQAERKASLVWRRQHPRRYDPRQSRELTREQVDSLAPGEVDRLSRRPLGDSEVTALIEVAVQLHERALEHKKATRWWVPIATAVLAFGGALAGAWISG